EQGLVLRRLDRLAVDGVDDVQREVALAVLGPADAAGDVVAGAQVEAADLRRADVGVVGAGQVRSLGRAQEAEAVGQDFQHAVGLHAFAVAGQHLQDREDDVLLARARHAFADLQLVGDFQQFVRGRTLEVAQRIDGEALRYLRVRARHEVLAVAAVVGHAAVARAVTLAVAAVLEALAAAVVAVAVMRLAAVLLALSAAFALLTMAFARLLA